MKLINLLFLKSIILILLFSCGEDSINPISSDTADSIPLINGSPNNLITKFHIPYLDTVISANINYETNSIAFEAPIGMNIESLAPIIEISEGASIIPSSGEVHNLFDEFIYTVTAENGTEQKFSVNFYTSNLLRNLKVENSEEYWTFVNDAGIKHVEDTGYMFYSYGQDDLKPEIRQTVDFNRDYSNKYILFIANMWKDKVPDGSISGDPYIWAVQYGDFLQDDWPYLQGMGHHDENNTWKRVHGIHKLLNGINEILFTMQQGRGSEPYNGTPNKILNVEMRIFNHEKDAEYYVKNIYTQF